MTNIKYKKLLEKIQINLAIKKMKNRIKKVNN